MNSAITRPSMMLFASEPLRAAGDLLGHLGRRARPAVQPCVESHAVILFPGLATDGWAMRPLGRYLAGLRYQVLDWGQGFNTGPKGDVDIWLAALTQRVLALADAASEKGGSVSLVGWSLGGFYAREIAKLAPQRVRHVITIGTPFNLARGRTNVDWLFRLLNRNATPDTAPLRERLALPPPVPTMAIYSRRDGVVAWQACQHGHTPRRGEAVKDIEVSASHLGMGWSREVMEVVGRELASSSPRCSR